VRIPAVARAQPVAESRWTAGKVLRVGAAVLGGALLLCVAIGFATSKRVSGASMRPTLRSGDRVMVDTSAYHKSAPGRFDVVALHAPGVPGLAFRRVVGLPGDRVQILAVDGQQQLLIQPGSRGTWYTVVAGHHVDWGGPCCGTDGAATGGAAVAVPAHEYFVLGDNPAAARDSRAFGFVPRSRIAGRVLLRAWPPGSVGGRPRLVPLAR
jgi:signal peptidase I